MSVDSYLFIDRDKAYVYVRSASEVYGGFSEEAIVGQEPSYKGKDYKDAVRWSSKYEPIEYGIYTGTLCSGCEKEVETEKEHYPLCRWCHLFREIEVSLKGREKKLFLSLRDEIRPYLP